MRREIERVKIRRFIARYLSNFVYRVNSLKFQYLNFNKKPPVIILTPGKVGSSSVYYTLKKNLINNSVFHIHYLSEEGIKRAKENHLNSDRKSLPLHLIVSELLYKKLKSYKGKIKVITIIREPISRSISSFFQNIDFYKDSIEDNNLMIDESKAIGIIKKEIINSVNDINNWLSLEIENNFNIDIYSREFPKEKYIISKNNRVELLLLKMEDLNNVFTNSSKDFFVLKNGIELENYNVGEKKYYSKQYRNLKNNIKLDDSIINDIISSNYYNHFYKEDFNNTIKKYSKNN